MTGADVVKLVSVLDPLVAVPAHYDGWSHFRDGETGMRAAIRDAPLVLREKFRWLPDGSPVDLPSQLNTADNPPERTIP
jgi:L-ascorbate metabolism protein UlaG (beta-lactamase superfamily)